MTDAKKLCRDALLSEAEVEVKVKCRSGLCLNNLSLNLSENWQTLSVSC